MPLNAVTFIDKDRLDFANAGGVFEYSEEVGDVVKTYRGFIPESNFPFDCTSITNSIKKMYPCVCYPIEATGYFTVRQG